MKRALTIAFFALLAGCYGKPEPKLEPEPAWLREPTAVLGVQLYKPLPKIPNCPPFSKYAGAGVKGLQQYDALYYKLDLCKEVNDLSGRIGGPYDAPILKMLGLHIDFIIDGGVVKGISFEVYVNRQDLLSRGNGPIRDMQELLIERYGHPTSVAPFNGYEVTSRWTGEKVSMRMSAQDQTLTASIMDNELRARRAKESDERAAKEAVKRAGERSKL